MSERPAALPTARDRLNLIEALSADAVASDYASATSVARPRSRRQQVLVATVAVGLAGFVLAMGVSARLINAPVLDDQRQALRERVALASQVQEGLLEDLEQTRTEVVAARQENLEITQAGRALAAEIDQLELVTGYSPVRGPGVVVTLTDAPPDESGVVGDLERVLDTDVQVAVNGLWYAGAEAIAVNGQRLSARSAIRSAAGAILVNYRPLSPPYTIEAIGAPDSLLRDFLASQGAQDLSEVSAQYGIGFSTRAADELSMAAATTALPQEATIVAGEDGEAP